MLLHYLPDLSIPNNLLMFLMLRHPAQISLCLFINAKMVQMNYFKRLVTLVSPQRPQPSAIPRVAAKSDYTAEVAHLNVASIVSGEIDGSDYDAALASYLGSKK